MPSFLLRISHTPTLQSDTIKAWQIQLGKHFKYIWVIILWNLSESETETLDRLIKVFIFLHPLPSPLLPSPPRYVPYG